MNIILDAMGGDNAPFEIVKGAIEAKKEQNVDITLVGDKDKITDIIKKENANVNDFKIVHTTEVISNNESPTLAIKNKKDSSIVVGLNMLKEGKGDAFISAGSTGAVISGSMIYVRRIRGIIRAAVAPVIPGKNGPFMIIDSGANAECKVQNILQFAIMGSIYMKKIVGKTNPTVALVNIGTEEEKGNTLSKEAYQVLKNSDLNFVGNIEGRDIPNGDVDVVVCDGFVGNVVLKLYEGVAKVLLTSLKDEIVSSARAKLGAVLLMPVLKKFKKKFDYTEYGGAMFLGVNGTVLKIHGNSKAKEVKIAIKQASKIVSEDIVGNISTEIKKYIDNNQTTNQE